MHAPAYTRIVFIFVPARIPVLALACSHIRTYVPILPASAYEPPFQPNSPQARIPKLRSHALHRCYLCFNPPLCCFTTFLRSDSSSSCSTPIPNGRSLPFFAVDSPRSTVCYSSPRIPPRTCTCIKPIYSSFTHCNDLCVGFFVLFYADVMLRWSLVLIHDVRLTLDANDLEDRNKCHGPMSGVPCLS